METNNIWFAQKEPNERDVMKYIEYWVREKDRLTNGFYVGETYISGWLYWHTVYWTTEIDVILKNGMSVKKRGLPLFRDIEWEFAQALIRAETEHKGISLVGARRFGKTSLIASLSGWGYTIFDDIQIAITAGNSKDLKTVTDKIEQGLSGLPLALKKKRILDNWKEEVCAGWKDKKTGERRGSNSRILVRNFRNGEDPMATNGLAPKFQIIDEIGKIPNLKACYDACRPSWTNDFGQFGIPILTGTGGDMEVSKEAGEVFRDPKGYNLLQFEDEWEGSGKIGWFLPAQRARNEYKYPMSLSEFLKIDNPELSNIKILVSKEEEAMEKFIKPRRDIASAAQDPQSIVTEQAYFPIIPSESFLVVAGNPFPVQACKEQKKRLLDEGIKGQSISLYRDLNGKIKHKFSDNQPVGVFPVKKDTPKDGAIIAYELPMPDAPPFLYVGGIDPYNQSSSEYSSSLGSCYIFKRMTDITGETYQDMIVAHYCGRPNQISEWYENVEMLLEFYNATAMIENENPGFIQYCDNKHKAYLLADGQNYLKEITPNTSITNRNKGLPAQPKVIEHCMGHIIAYTKEEIQTGMDPDTFAPIKKLGVCRILDPMLLEEMISYREDGDKKSRNYDRIVAFRHAVAYARQLDKNFPIVHVDLTAYKEPVRKTINGPFLISPTSGNYSRPSNPFFMK